jgi:hypothetical protein
MFERSYRKQTSTEEKQTRRPRMQATQPCRTKRAADFQRSGPCPPLSSSASAAWKHLPSSSTPAMTRHAVCHRVWKLVRGPFLFPVEICTHTGKPFPTDTTAVGGSSMPSGAGSFPLWRCPRRVECMPDDGKKRGQGGPCSGSRTSWEVYDFNLAGCVLCGQMHVCADGSCDVEKNDQGHDICIITGLCVKMLNFCSDEFLDTVGADEAGGFMGSSPCSALEEDIWGGGAHNRPGEEEGASSSHAQFACNEPGDACKRQRMDAACCSNHPSHQNSDHGQLMHHKRGCAVHQTTCSAKRGRCSVNKKNRYRSWVYHRVMQQPPNGSDRRVVQGSYPSSLPLVRQVTLHGTSRHQRLLQGSIGAEEQKKHQPMHELLTWSLAGGLAIRSASGMHGPCGHPQELEFPGAALPTSLFHPSHAMLRVRTLPGSGGASAVGSSNMGHLIRMFVVDILCSPKWSKSMQMEVRRIRRTLGVFCWHLKCVFVCVFACPCGLMMTVCVCVCVCVCVMQEQKMVVKKRSLLLKAFKILKTRSNGCMISVPDAVSMVASMLGNVRCADAF